MSYNLTEQQLKEICKRCIENVKGLLNAEETLISNASTKKFALGLYMYAIEEYDKSIKLKNCFTSKGKANYQISKPRFGGGSRPSHTKNAHIQAPRMIK